MDPERAVLAFLVREEDITSPDMNTSTQAQRIAGIALAAMGSMMVVAALDWWLASYPGSGWSRSDDLDVPRFITNPSRLCCG
ncbi:MAG: hypothetical protein U5O39_19240 [Gammaproteobacteria bacterium]|nr:hypothetical protein [Gammaproteobacteria bacterium]